MESTKGQLHSRRGLLTCAAAATLLPTAGCSWLLPRKDLTPVCPNAPEVSYREGQLTIDAHCHVFNGTDLQVKEFLSRVAVKQGGVLGFAAKAIGELLQNLAWNNAPSGDEELAGLAELADALRSCTSAGYSSRVGSLRQAGYTRGRLELQKALQRSEQLRSLRQKREQGTLSVMPDSDDAAKLEAQTIIESLPEKVEDYKATSTSQAFRMQAFGGMSVQGLIDFVLQNFQYRYVNVHDYLATYNRPGNRVVDLMLPSLVDYDFWLAKGDKTPTSLQTQVQVMKQIALLTGGRVHAFAPFDPLRQVAFQLGHAREDSLTLVKDAVLKHGCVGVKLYPPMGFSALGNEERDGQGFWRQSWLPWWADRADLGRLLDGAMRELFQWCEDAEVPVMAHTSESNGPTPEFQKLTDSRYWALALGEFTGLRVSFGHFGSSTPVESGLKRAQDFSALMQASSAAAGKYAFADAGYFVEVISREPELQSIVRRLYEETSAKGDAALVNRFIYGTDWEMTLTEGPVDGYLGDFETLFAELEASPQLQFQRLSDLAARFFGLNAARWAGLAVGGATRRRLDTFYKDHQVEKPDWAVKLDRRGAAL